MAQREEGFEPLMLGPTEVGHVIKTGAAAQQSTHSNHQHVDQVMITTALDTRVGQVFEMFNQTELRMRLHPHSSIQYRQKYKCQNGTLDQSTPMSHNVSHLLAF